MRRATGTTLTREDCLRRALEQEWLAEQSPCAQGAAEAWDRARFYRSLALIAKPAGPARDDASASPG